MCSPGLDLIRVRYKKRPSLRGHVIAENILAGAHQCLRHGKPHLTKANDADIKSLIQVNLQLVVRRLRCRTTDPPSSPTRARLQLHERHARAAKQKP